VVRQRRHWQWRFGCVQRGTAERDAALRASISTEENGSGWVAQRLGGRLVVCRLEETAERAPIASTPVASRSPVNQSRVACAWCRALPCPGCLRAPIHTNPKLALASCHTALVFHLAIRIAAGPSIIAERDAPRRVILAGGRTRVLVLEGRDRLRVLARKRPRRPVERELLETHFGVADELRRLVLGLLIEPSAPTTATLIQGYRGVEVGAVALLVVISASLGLFKAGSACN
jgi:hypothetical protein